MIVVVFAAALFLGWKTISLVRTNKEYIARESSAMEEYEAESRRGDAIDESAEYIKSPQYVEDVAHTALGLDYPEDSTEDNTFLPEEVYYEDDDNVVTELKRLDDGTVSGDGAEEDATASSSSAASASSSSAASGEVDE